MLVRTVLKRKGFDVVSVQETESIKEVAAVLTRWRIGAVLVRDGSGRVVGILSERDIVAGIATRGDACLTLQAGDLMERNVVTCGPEDSIDDIMVLMTERRMRHLPVMEEGHLVGLISIGDVVKSRISEIESESNALRSYIATG